MRSLLILGIITISFQASAFDFKGLMEKVAKDKETQEQIKDAAKKGYEYFQGDKKEDQKQEEAKAPAQEKKESVTK